jgi:hypothetical protein
VILVGLYNRGLECNFSYFSYIFKIFYLDYNNHGLFRLLGLVILGHTDIGLTSRAAFCGASSSKYLKSDIKSVTYLKCLDGENITDCFGFGLRGL